MIIVDDGFVVLGDLPVDHRLRNTPLHQIGAEYQWVDTKKPQDWHRVTRSFKIAKNTFNELGTTWTLSYRWRVPQ
jgi:hypothetical protein